MSARSKTKVKAVAIPEPWEWTGLFVEADGEVIAQILREPAEVYGRLTAAAPDLLKALQTLLHAYQNDHGGDAACLNLNAACNQARAAIAKATATP